MDTVASAYRDLISIHAPREGGDLVGSRYVLKECGISIHAPREGGDAGRPAGSSADRYFNPRPPRGGRRLEQTAEGREYLFQSTPPARGATPMLTSRSAPGEISIHAPREGGDSLFGDAESQTLGFQSTPPARGATSPAAALAAARKISIHAPREGGDFGSFTNPQVYGVFQSTPPARGATAYSRYARLGAIFQSTPPARGATTSV